MAKTVKITTDNKISVVDIPWGLEGWYGAIGGGCDIVETVKTQRMFDLFRMPVLMIVNEEGVVRGQEFNLAASLLYGMAEHGCVIAGNVLIGIPSGPDILPPADPEAVKRMLAEAYPFLEEEEVEEVEEVDHVGA